MDPRLRDALNQVVVGVRGETREALDRFSAELRGEMQMLGTELRGDMRTLGTELRGEMQTLGTELRGEMQTRGTEMRDEFRASVAEMRRHFDVVGESLRSDIRAAIEGTAASREQTDRRIDEEARRRDGLEGRVVRLEVRVKDLEDDRKPRRSRRGR